MIDEFVSREKMLKSLKKIGHSLNCRFEKDADLFISNQKSEEIKNYIHNANWEGIYGMYTTNDSSADILSIEIIKYSWLINNISNKDAKYINEIFNSCNKNIFVEKANRIINNEVYSPYSIKQLIIPTYYMNIDINICKEILDFNKDNLLFNELVRKVCVKRVLDTCQTPRSLYNTMKKYLNLNKIYNDSNVFKFYVENLDKDESFIYELGNDIFKLEIEDKIKYRDSKWFKIFRSFGKITFDICSTYLDEYADYNREFSKSIARYLMSYQFKNDRKNLDYFEGEWIRLFKSGGSGKRHALILGLKNIWNKESKEKIANSMLENINITPKQRELIESILGSEDELLNPINESILDILLNDKLNSNNRNGNLNFLAAQFLRRYKLIEELDIILKNINNTNVEDFIIQLINQSRKVDNKILRYLLNTILINIYEMNQEMAITKDCNLENKIISIIESSPSDFNNVRDIIQNYDFDFYKKVFGNI